MNLFPFVSGTDADRVVLLVVNDFFQPSCRYQRAILDACKVVVRVMSSRLDSELFFIIKQGLDNC